jgi:hypothetical protein
MPKKSEKYKKKSEKTKRQKIFQISISYFKIICINPKYPNINLKILQKPSKNPKHPKPKSWKCPPRQR